MSDNNENPMNAMANQTRANMERGAQTAQE